jgi:cell division protein FtsI/penicillin-binding protein 2
MWRNGCISDTYEPGSTFKIITAAAGLEEGVVSTKDSFSCPGFIMVEDRKIRCHKTAGHGSQSFVEATMNSCKQVFGKLRPGVLKSMVILTKTQRKHGKEKTLILVKTEKLLKIKREVFLSKTQ